MVLELQATLGNKWAAIATYLPGRTDNDVKNFWSTRQKRLARILRASSQPNRTLKNKAKTPVVDEASSLQVRTPSPFIHFIAQFKTKITSDEAFGSWEGKPECLMTNKFGVGVPLILQKS